MLKPAFVPFMGPRAGLPSNDSSYCSLGTLDNELLERLPCEAHIGFSELYIDTLARPKVQAQAMPLL